MRVNIENAVRHSQAKGGHAFLLAELVRHLKELRDRTDRGDMTAVTEFFELYRFDDNQCDERPNQKHEESR